MEASVLVELVEPFHEFVEVDILPAVVQFGTVTNEHDFPIVDVEVDGHIHHSFVPDAVLGADFAGEGDGDMLLVGSKPCLGILSVLPCEVV